MTISRLCSVPLHYEYDLVAARRRARQVAALLGFDGQDQTRVATVASEIARNALRYAGGGQFDFAVEVIEGIGSIVMTVFDRGPGIANLADILAGNYRSRTGMGLGLVGARRLMDDFEITTEPDRGTTVLMKKRLPAGVQMTPERVEKILKDISTQLPETPIEEMQRQNAELLQALADLNDRQDDLERLNTELEDTNRGVLALYAELDEKAASIRHADDLKTRFLSDMSHEFRTPVNSILALARLLGEGNLSDEEQKQVELIRHAADDLATLVNDLLDLAKIEAGKVEIRPAEFEVANLFSALRGMLRPLLLNRSVSLVFEEPEGVPMVFSDEGKVSQILRNFISNALKFTEAGEVRITASVGPDGQTVIFSVADTGIGISPGDQERIFEEFTQVDNRLQKRQQGTGLGLPLTRKLAALLGGSVGLRSEPGLGSTFYAELPIHFASSSSGEARSATPKVASPIEKADTSTQAIKILTIDDDQTARYTISSFASRPGAEIIEAENGLLGIEIALRERPDLIMLDLMMPGIGGHEVLQRLRSDPATASIPVIVVTSRFINDDERRLIMSRAQAVIYKGDLSREIVTKAIDTAFSETARMAVERAEA